MIRALTSSAAFASLHEQLGILMADGPDGSATWYANFLRRACAIYCPIPRGKLLHVTTELLNGIVESPCDLEGKIDFAINGLFQSGDLIEISRFQSSDEHYSGDWVFLAPPSFVKRESGRVYIYGIAIDDSPILPISLLETLKSIGPYRYLPSSDTQTINLLQSVGLRNIPETLWCAIPKKHSPQEFLEQASRRLANAPPAGALSNVRIFQKNQAEPITYRKRWTSPQSESGNFVCRRPSGYGAENWCYAELDQGRVVRFIDLPWAGEKLRGCDAGWQLQLAIDSVSGHPATYRVEQQSNEKIDIRFSFPIPLWAQRRFQAVDDHFNSSPFRCSFTQAEWPTEKNVIENVLWFISEK